MAKYTVHFSGYYGYTVDVEAENKEEALAKAEAVYVDVDPREFAFEEEQPDIWEERK